MANMCHCYIHIGIYYPAKNTLPVILMEKMQFGLANVVEKHGDLTLNKTTIILNDVCLGLQYLHTRIPPIVHRDLTPNNILLCHHLRAKISDLGMARILQTTDTKTLTQAPGTPAFMPPECLADKPVYDLAIDIFSFGGVILYIATQQWPHPAPWISFDPYTGKKSILSSELQRRQQYLDKMARTYESLKPLAISCLDDNPKKRPTVKEVSIEIKKISNVKCQVSMYCDIWAGDDPTQTQKQQERLQDRQQKQGHQHKQDQQEKIEQQNQQDEQQSIRLENQQQSLQVMIYIHFLYYNSYYALLSSAY